MTANSYFACVKLPLIAAICALIGVGVFARRGWFDWRRIVRQNEELASKVEIARLQKDDLETRTEALQSDREAQERVVRQFLGYIRRDETIIEF